MLVYKITNTINDKVYIGQTVNSLKKRWMGHRVDCKRNKNNHPMYNAMRKHGVENFTIEEISGANSHTELNYQEWLLIHKNNTLWPNGYNMKEGGGSGGKHSQETKKKQSEYWVRYYKNKKREGNPVINIKTGELFVSCTAAAKSVGIGGSCLSAKLIGKIGNETNLRYVGMEDVCKKPIPKNEKKGQSKQVVNIKTGNVYKSAKKVIDLKLVSVKHSAFKSKLNGTIGNDTDFRYLNPKNDKSKGWVGNTFTKKSRKVINTATKEIFSSIKKCEKANGFNNAYLKDRLRGQCKHNIKTEMFMYLDEYEGGNE